jgi:fructosamine-3-kinase
VKQLSDARTFSKKDVELAEIVCNNMDDLFPAEPPSLLHGDLWSGNYMVASHGKAAMYDPAVYYGHREMDIGMTRLFGGFDQKFYSAYQETYPLQPGWQQRVELTQLYPVLVHAILFGGHYVSDAREKLVCYGTW